MFALKEKNRRLICAFYVLLTLVACSGSQSDVPEGIPLGEILEQPDPRLKTTQLLAYFEGATGADLPEIEAAFDAARPKLDPVSCTLLAQWWVQFDPISAFNDGLDHVWMDRTLWAGAVFREWARIAPEAALARAMEIPQSAGQEWRRNIALALIRGWFDGGAEPGPLIDFIIQLPLGRPQKESLDVMLGRMIDDGNFDAATAFVEGLPDAGEGRLLKADAFRRLATVLTRSDPARGLAWLEKHGSGPFGKNMNVRVGRLWGRQQGQPAMEWALGLPVDQEGRERTIVETFRGWSAADPSGSQSWLEQQPWAPELEGVLKISIQREARQDPMAAIARAEKIEDAALRDEMLGMAGQIWINLDAEAANAWMAKANLSGAVERAIRQPLSGQPGIVRPMGGGPKAGS
jgi:hypothetical protein